MRQVASQLAVVWGSDWQKETQPGQFTGSRSTHHSGTQQGSNGPSHAQQERRQVRMKGMQRVLLALVLTRRPQSYVRRLNTRQGFVQGRFIRGGGVGVVVRRFLNSSLSVLMNLRSSSWRPKVKGPLEVPPRSGDHPLASSLEEFGTVRKLVWRKRGSSLAGAAARPELQWGMGSERTLWTQKELARSTTVALNPTSVLVIAFVTKEKATYTNWTSSPWKLTSSQLTSSFVLDWSWEWVMEAWSLKHWYFHEPASQPHSSLGAGGGQVEGREGGPLSSLVNFPVRRWVARFQGWMMKPLNWTSVIDSSTTAEGRDVGSEVGRGSGGGEGFYSNLR